MASVDDSIDDARKAAAHAGVVVRSLDRADEMSTASAMLASVWKLEEGRTFVNPELMTALTHAGNYVAGAFAGSELIGCCVGFFAEPLGRTLHSHIAGVDPAYASRGVGTAIKLHERSWALRRGLTEITWTFDPLVARNAYFDITRLGAEPVEFLIDFYGPMDDSYNAGQPTDRMLLNWSLAAPLSSRGPAAPRVGDADPAAHDAVTTQGGRPVPAGVLPGNQTKTARVQIPSDFTALRHDDPQLALRWRLAFREAMQLLLNHGWRIRGFDRAGYYLLERD